MLVKQTRSVVKIALVIAGFALATGCTTNATVEQAQSDAERALQAAEQAQRTAEQALEAARAAQQAADSAERCCQDNRRELNRALERMQQK